MRPATAPRHDPKATARVAAPRAVGGSSLTLAAALLTVYLVWGSTYLAIRIALEGLPPLAMGALRFLAAGSLLYTALRLRGVAAPTRVQWANATATGGFLLLGGNGLVTISEQWVTSGLAALGVATAPLWAVCFAAARGERPRRVEMTGLVVGFAGIVLLNAGTDLAATPLGGVLLLGASMLWGTGSMWSRGRDLPPGPMAAAAEMLGGGTLMALVSLGLGERFTAVPGPRALLAFGYLVVFGSIVAFSAYTYLLHRVRPALATSNSYVNPLVAVLLGCLLGGEHFALGAAVAMAAILAGVALVVAGNRGRNSGEPAP